MRAVHDLLPPKIPDVRLHIIAVDLHWPFGDLDAGRAFEFFVFVGDEAMNECGFSDAAAAYEDELEFIRGVLFGTANARTRHRSTPVVFCMAERSLSSLQGAFGS